MEVIESKKRLIFARYVALTVTALSIVAVYRLAIHVNQTTVALTFLVLVLVVATRWRLAYSVYLSLLCTALYNLFFLPPLGKLIISDPQNWVALGALLSASVLVSHLSNRERRAAESSEARREEVERLYEFSQQLLLQDEPGRLARMTPSLIAGIFHLRGVALYVREQATAYYSDPDSELLPPARLKAAAEAESPVQVAPGVRLVPLALGMRSSGALAMTEGEYSEGIYEAIGGLVAIALERASALERFSHLEASREGERLRSALLDSVTHELRTPLTAIRAAATTLSSQPMGEPERGELYEVIEEESARLNHLVGQAVEMAQLDSESLQVRLQPLPTRQVIDLALEDMRSLLRDRAIQVNIPDDQPAIAMDGELVRRVLRQLVENAAKYSPAKSSIAISSQIVEERLLVSVSNEGPGIDAEEAPFVFDKFFRGRRRERVQGSGMGLAIARAILRAHGGGIEVKSSPGQGATFTFWLPLRNEAGGAGDSE